MEQLLNIDFDKISTSSNEEILERKKSKIIFRIWFSK